MPRCPQGGAHPPGQGKTKGCSTLSKRQMLRAAAGLLADKAVRSQLEVQDSVPGMTSPDADLILPKLAYVFRNGDTSLPVPGLQLSSCI